jgi:predicted Zn-dependent protease
VNPFDLLARHVEHGKNKISDNDAYDMKIASYDESVYSRVVVLHELGHALGIVGETEEGVSVMRSGIGPSKQPTFIVSEKQQIRLKYNQ